MPAPVMLAMLLVSFMVLFIMAIAVCLLMGAAEENNVWALAGSAALCLVASYLIYCIIQTCSKYPVADCKVIIGDPHEDSPPLNWEGRQVYDKDGPLPEPLDWSKLTVFDETEDAKG